MARFNSYSKKQKPDGTDTLLIYDDDESPDTLKRIDIQALFEEYEVKPGKSVKQLVEALQAAVEEAAVARYQ